MFSFFFLSFSFYAICSDSFIYIYHGIRETYTLYIIDEGERERSGLISEIAACIRTCKERGGSTVQSRAEIYPASSSSLLRRKGA